MIKSENTEKHKELRQLFNKETGIYAIKDNESYMNWLENMVVKNCSIPFVSVSSGVSNLDFKAVCHWYNMVLSHIESGKDDMSVVYEITKELKANFKRR